MSLINNMIGIRGGNNGASLGILIGGILIIGGLVQMAEVPRVWEENKKSQATLWMAGLVAGLSAGITASYYTWNPLFNSLHQFAMNPEKLGMSESAANWYAGGITFGVVAIMTGLLWNSLGILGYTLGKKVNTIIEDHRGENSINSDGEMRLLNRPSRGKTTVPV